MLNIDLAATILDYAKVDVLKVMQGRSFASICCGEMPSDWRSDFFYEHLFERKNIPKSEGVRNERFTYVRWFEQVPLVEELYDRTADADQVRNLVNEAEFAGTLATLRKRTTELRDAYGGPYRPNPAKPKP